MKALFTALMMTILISGCEVIIVEPVYDPRDKFVGDYEFEEYSETFDEVYNYHISIRKSSHDDTEVYIKNFYDASLKIYGWVDHDKITIPMQEVDMYEIEGTATYREGEITFFYTVYDLIEDSPTDFCHGVAW